MRRLMLVTTVATLAAGTAIADQYWVHDLGTTATHEECMARARKVFDAYVGANGGLGVDAASWTVYAWDMASRGQDGVIICLEGADGIDDVTLVIHGPDDEDSSVTDAVVALWER